MFGQFRDWFRLNAKPFSEMNALPVRGSVKVRGYTEVGSPITAPLSQEECVFYELFVYEWFNGNRKLLFIERSSSLFRITDGEAHVFIDPADGELRCKTWQTTAHSSRCLSLCRTLLSARDIAMVDFYGELRSLDLEERMLPPKTNVVAFGAIRSELDARGMSSYRESPQRNVLCTQGDIRLLLTPKVI